MAINVIQVGRSEPVTLVKNLFNFFSEASILKINSLKLSSNINGSLFSFVRASDSSRILIRSEMVSEMGFSVYLPGEPSPYVYLIIVMIMLGLVLRFDESKYPFIIA